jgi:Icc-related predicted phosphoesterase
MKSKIAILIHTNSAYSDLWEAFFKRLSKYLLLDVECYLLTDTIKTHIYSINYTFKEIFIYNKETLFIENLDIPVYSFSERFKMALNTITNEYILVLFDNNILYDYTDTNEWNILEQWIYLNTPATVRLCTGLNDLKFPLIYCKNYIYKLHPNAENQVSNYPTIWNRQLLLNIINTYPKLTYHNLETEEIYKYVRGSVYIILNEKLQPLGCSVFISPPILKFAHVISKGKWYTDVYKKIIQNISNEFNIDLSIRGQHISMCLNNLLPNTKHDHICFK